MSTLLSRQSWIVLANGVATGAYGLLALTLPEPTLPLVIVAGSVACADGLSALATIPPMERSRARPGHHRHPRGRLRVAPASLRRSLAG
jgi:hypothetical protein